MMFIDKQSSKGGAGFGRTNITVAGNMRHWLYDWLKTLVGVVETSVNIDF